LSLIAAICNVHCGVNAPPSARRHVSDRDSGTKRAGSFPLMTRKQMRDSDVQIAAIDGFVEKLRRISTSVIDRQSATLVITASDHRARRQPQRTTTRTNGATVTANVATIADCQFENRSINRSQ